MLKRILVLVLLASVAGGAFGQHRSFSLDQGHLALGLSPGGGGGAQISGPTWAADSLSLEGGLTDELSLGLKTSFVHTLGSGIQDNDWRPKAGGWVTFDAGRAWLSAADWGVHVSAVGQFDPQESSTALIATADFSGRVVPTEALEVALLVDTGLQSDLRSLRWIVLWGGEVRLFHQWSLLVSFAGNLYVFGSSETESTWQQSWTRFHDSVNLAELSLKYWW